jgi:hypothetical protein
MARFRDQPGSGIVRRHATCCYRVLRPAWFTNVDEIDYETTQKGERFRGSIVSRKSVAALVVKLAESPELDIRRSLGVSRPGS